MPTYQYRCAECGNEFEIVQSFADDALTRCENCGRDGLHKVYGNVGVVFKGSGFYATDNRSSRKHGSSSTASPSSSSTSESSSSSSSSDQAKPAAA